MNTLDNTCGCNNDSDPPFEDNNCPSDAPLDIIHVNQNNNKITAFLYSRRIDNDRINQPITCTMAQRGRSGGIGSLFEISPQVGCHVRCNFCACGAFKDNLNPNEVVEQLRILKSEAALRGMPVIGPSKVGFSDGGEFIMNPNCPEIFEAVTSYMPVIIKISTTMPDDPVAHQNLEYIFEFMQNYAPIITLQVSLYSTDEMIRGKSSRTPLIPFARLRSIGERWKARHPNGRKITLTFTLTNDSHCEPEEIRDTLPPDLFRIRLHPYKDNNMEEKIETMFPQRCGEIYSGFSKLGYEITWERYSESESRQLLTGGTRSLIGRTL